MDMLYNYVSSEGKLKKESAEKRISMYIWHNLILRELVKQ